MHKYYILFGILAISGVTHLWNVSHFPVFHADEGHYIRRALHVLSGQGPQESDSRFDHPYFGQLFLAMFMAVLGYPFSVHPSLSISSIEMLYGIPRFFMGLLAIADTFLIYKIAQRRYGCAIGATTALFFAAMPMTWQLRRVVLDSIQLPFILSSILLVMYLDGKLRKWRIRNSVIVTLSGVMLGIAIFTKIPAFTIIPVVLYLIFTHLSNASHLNLYRLKIIGLWLVPVLSIPSIWPLYAFHSGQFTEWVHDVFWQAGGRGDRMIALNVFTTIDPLLFAIGLAGLGATICKKDPFLLLWIIPFLLFIVSNGWFSSFHWNTILPAFCIAAGQLPWFIAQKARGKTEKKVIPLMIIGVISIFGLTSTLLLIGMNLTSAQFESSLIALKYLEPLKGNAVPNSSNISVVSGPAFSWLFKYVFGFSNAVSTFRHGTPLSSDRGVFVMDRDFNDFIQEKTANSTASTGVLVDNDSKTRWIDNGRQPWIVLDLGYKNNICEIKISWYKGAERSYYFGIVASNNDLSPKIIGKFNSTGKSSAAELYSLPNTSATRLNITVFGNSKNQFASITDLSVYGRTSFDHNNECVEIPIKKIVTSPKSRIVSNVDTYLASIMRMLSKTRLVAVLSPNITDNREYPFTSLKYTIPESISIRAN